VQEKSKTSEHFICHAWNKKNGLIYVCTDAGEMLVLENSGEFKAFIHECPKGRAIEAVIPFSKGVICAVEDNIYFYEAADEKDENRVPLT
jgi:hypothetical protein